MTLQSTDSAVIPYPPSSSKDTRFQTERRARADAGDLQARLDSIPLSEVQDQLSRCFRPLQPEYSILDSLQAADGTIPQYRAASLVLEELADTTQQAAWRSALVYRYVQAYTLWKGHPNPDVISAESFLNTLDNSDFVKANIVIGSSSDRAKQRSLTLIEEKWGDRWFDQLPTELRDPAWTGVKDCSQRMLSEIAMNVQRGYAMDEAIAHWTHFMKQRRDEKQRRELKIGFPRFPYLILDDVRSLNNKARMEKVTQEAWQTAVLDAVRDDRLRVEIVPPGGLAEHATPTKPSHVNTVVGPTGKSKKRSREVPSATVIEPSDDGSVVVADGAVVENDGWRAVAGGKEKVKRFGSVLVRQPVTPVDLLLSGVQRSSHGVEVATQVSPWSSDPSSSQPEESKDDSGRAKRTCDGQGVARLLHKFVDAFRDVPALDADPAAAHGCCETCRPKAVEAFEAIERVLLQYAAELEDVQAHHFRGAEITPSQIVDISPDKHSVRRRRERKVIPDSSDEE